MSQVGGGGGDNLWGILFQQLHSPGDRDVTQSAEWESERTREFQYDCSMKDHLSGHEFEVGCPWTVFLQPLFSCMGIHTTHPGEELTLIGVVALLNQQEEAMEEARVEDTHEGMMTVISWNLSRVRRLEKTYG